MSAIQGLPTDFDRVLAVAPPNIEGIAVPLYHALSSPEDLEFLY